MSRSQTPEVVTLGAEELDRLLVELRGLLPRATYQLVEGLLRTLQWVMGLLEEKRASIGRLRRMVFGAQTEKTSKVFPARASDPPAAGAEKKKRKGHGRRGAKEYSGARRVKVPHPHLCAGVLCPKCFQGRLRLLVPSLLVRIAAQPVFQATLYEIGRLRCALCGEVFKAPVPPEANEGKHDANVGPMLALLRYGAGLPMYRIEKWQKNMGVPLPASTQWELINAAATVPAAVYEALIDTAAQGRLLHNDDTTMRVQSLRQEIAAEAKNPAQRTGIFTTNIVALVEERKVALFFTGRKHAGENLDQVLQRRAAGLAKPLQMCDALSRNEAAGSKTDLCNCIPHGRRNFVDVIESFPEECRMVIESLREIFRVEALAKERKLSDAERLVFHQEQSQPVMDRLHQWMKEQTGQKKVEPNSGLGKAIRYMLKHWEALTRFLRTPGAPLDNNICERALKLAILHRKNSLSYKTLRGARVGDVFMSLIHTCELNQINPFDYLMTLQRHSQEVLQQPSRWLPWNYRQGLPRADTG